MTVIGKREIIEILLAARKVEVPQREGHFEGAWRKREGHF